MSATTIAEMSRAQKSNIQLGNIRLLEFPNPDCIVCRVRGEDGPGGRAEHDRFRVVPTVCHASANSGCLYELPFDIVYSIVDNGSVVGRLKCKQRVISVIA